MIYANGFESYASCKLNIINIKRNKMHLHTLFFRSKILKTMCTYASTSDVVANILATLKYQTNLGTH
jgi:hypothetical protein